MKVLERENDPTASVLKSAGGGFDFELTQRNAMLAKDKTIQQPKVTKTGTTICGIHFKDGVILGTDTRSSAGSIVADPNCQKLHHITDNIWAAGAGTAADCDRTTEMIEVELQLLKLATGQMPRVISCTTRLSQYLFRYQGHIGCYLIIGGYDDLNGPQLYQVYAHGSVSDLPFVTMGSGSLAAMSVLEGNWKPGLQENEAKELVADAIQSGIVNDLGSGSNVDLVVITKDGATLTRKYREVGKTGKCAKYVHRPIIS